MKKAVVRTAAAAATLSAVALGFAQPAAADLVGSMPGSRHIHMVPGEVSGYAVHDLCGLGSVTDQGSVSVKLVRQHPYRLQFNSDMVSQPGTYSFDYTVCSGDAQRTGTVRVTVRPTEDIVARAGHRPHTIVVTNPNTRGGRFLWGAAAGGPHGWSLDAVDAEWVPAGATRTVEVDETYRSANWEFQMKHSGWVRTGTVTSLR